MVIFMTNTGARLGEMLKLDWRNVDLTARRVVFVDTKNGTDRGVSLNTDAFDAIASLDHRSGPVFLNARGKPYEAERNCSVEASFKLACKRAGIEGVTPHTLRHTFASWLVMAGIPLRTVAELLGHKRLDMVMRYSHLSTDHLASAVDVLVQNSCSVQQRRQNIQ
jgi:integrase